MADHLAPDAGRLEDDHGLQQQRVDEAQLANQGCHAAAPREAVEYRVQVVHGVPKLVQRLIHGYQQSTVAVEGAVFEERTDHVGRGEEPLVLGVGLLGGREDRGRPLG